jgi:hypothetical protein
MATLWKLLSSKWLLNLTITVFVAMLVGLSFRIGQRSATPNEVLLFTDNRSAITDYVDRIITHDIPIREDGKGYYLLNILATAGLKSVQEENGCILFTFNSMPTDSVHQLVYSPKGFRGLPPLTIRRDKGRHLTHFQHIEGFWFYLEWDAP